MWFKKGHPPQQCAIAPGPAEAEGDRLPDLTDWSNRSFLDRIQNRELPLWLQSAALLAAWLVWLLAIGWVSWRAHENAKIVRMFAHPVIIGMILFGGIPGPLAW